MKRMKCFVLVAGLLAGPALWAGIGEGAKLVETTSSKLKKGMEGVTHADGPTDFVFDYKKGEFRIPYLQITGLHYGNKSHLAIRYNLLLGIHPTKVHDYMLTIDYTDEDKAPQSVMFQLGKNRIWNTLINLQSKSGQTIHFDNVEACKHAAKDAPPGQMDCSNVAAPAQDAQPN